MVEVVQAQKGHALKSLSSGENLNTKIRDFVAILIQFTTSSRRLDGGTYCGAPVGGK